MDKYKIVKNLGDGTYGTVFKAENKETGEVVAIKKMKKKYKNWDECMSLREVKSLRKMNHPNLVRLKEVVQVKEELLLVFEYMELNLYQMYMRYKEKRQSIPEIAIKRIIYQVALGLDSLHKIGYFHRDLKPENILFNTQQSLVKVCDFGLAREVRCRPPFTEYVSTRWYRAPEILLHSQTYNSPIDIFALGCIMGELYNLAPLFSGANELDQFYKIVNLLGTPQNWAEGVKLAQKKGVQIPQRESVPLQQIVPKASPEAIQLLSDMLQYDSSKRPTASQIVRYPYFDEVAQEFKQSFGSSQDGIAQESMQRIKQMVSAPSMPASQFKTQDRVDLPNLLSKQYADQQSQQQGQHLQSQMHQPSLLNKQLRNSQQQMSLTNLNQLGFAAGKPQNPFQSYKDEFIKSQSIYASTNEPVEYKRIQQNNPLLFDQTKSNNNLLMNPMAAAAGQSNYHFQKNPSNLYSTQELGQNQQIGQKFSTMSLGGTLERPLNLNYQMDAMKTTRKQNMLLNRKQYEGQAQGGGNGGDSQYTTQQVRYNENHPPANANYEASQYFNQFNKLASMNQQNYASSGFLPLSMTQQMPLDRRNKKLESEVQEMNKIFEDKLNWAF